MDHSCCMFEMRQKKVVLFIACKKSFFFKLFLHLTKKCNLFTSVLPEGTAAQATRSAEPKTDVLVSLKIKLAN